MTGVPEHWFGGEYLLIHYDVWDALPSLEAAVLLARLVYRTRYIPDRSWCVTREELSTDTRLSLRKMDRAISELLELGLIGWERASAENATKRIWVVWDEDPAQQNVEHPVLSKTWSTPSSKNVNNSSPPSDDGAEPIQSTESFDDWWNEWPYKVDKGAARKAYAKALKITDPTCLLSGLLAQVDTLRESMKPDEKGKVYCPYPATWLNGERWNDEVTPRIVLPDKSDPHAWRERQPGETKNQWMDRVYGTGD